jgi:hypothetical protein
MIGSGETLDRLVSAFLFCLRSNPAGLPLMFAPCALCAACPQSFHRKQEDLAVADEAERQLDATPDTLSLQDQLQHKEQQAVQGAGVGEEEVQAQAQVRADGAEEPAGSRHCTVSGLAGSCLLEVCLPACLKLPHSLCCRRSWQR